MAVEMRLDLALGLGDKAEIPAVAERTRRSPQRKRAGIPEGIEQTRAPTELVDALRAPAQVVLLFERRLCQCAAALRISCGQTLALVKRLGTDLAHVIDAHQRGRLGARIR